MAVSKNATKTTLGLRFALGADENGKAQYKLHNLSTIKPAASDQNVYDVAASLSGLMAGTIADITRTDAYTLVNE